MGKKTHNGTTTENTLHLGPQAFGQMEIRNAVIAAVGAHEVTPNALLHLSQTFGPEVASKIASNAVISPNGVVPEPADIAEGTHVSPSSAHADIPVKVSSKEIL